MSALLILLLALTGFASPQPSAVDKLPACSGRTDVVSVWRDDPTPCDLHRPQRLDIYGLTIPECDDQGGEPIILTTGEGVCEGADY